MAGEASCFLIFKLQYRAGEQGLSMHLELWSSPGIRPPEEVFQQIMLGMLPSQTGEAAHFDDNKGEGFHEPCSSFHPKRERPAI